MGRHCIITAIRPESYPEYSNIELAVKLESLQNKTIGFLSNSKPNVDALLEKLATKLNKQFNIKERKYTKKEPGFPAPIDLLKEIRSNCDAAVIAVGD